MKSINLLWLSLLSAGLLILSWPVNGLPIFIFISIVPILIIEDRIRLDKKRYKRWRLFLFNYITFLLWNLSITWWIVNSTVAGMLLANILNALFFSLLFQFFYLVKNIVSTRLAYIFIVCLWICFEKLHLSWDISWPWLNLGNVFSEWIAIIQWYEFTGSFGGTLWILLVNILFFEIYKKGYLLKSQKLTTKTLIPPIAIIVAPCIISILLYLKPLDDKDEVQVLLLQPNIDSYSEKYNSKNHEFVVLLDSLTRKEKSKDYHYIVTPETYFAEGFGEEINNFRASELYESLQEYLIDRPNTQLITGLQLYQVYQSDFQPTITSNYIRENIWVDYYNSAASISLNKQPEYYHKSKLVVGVENLPFKEILRPIIGNTLIDLGGTVASRATQDYRSVFSHPTIDVKVGPIICYESVYGEFVADYVRNGATLLSVLTNDSWWGNTSGHRQLLSYTRLRAIETRRDIVRSANTGISAFINSKGKIISTLDYQEQGILTGFANSNQYKTFYVRYGDYIYRCSGLLLILISLHIFSLKLRKLFIRRESAPN